MEYKFLDRTDDELIATSELQRENGIAIAVRTTGYEVGNDEIVQIAIVDFDGQTLFEKTVKPQNIEEWEPSEASGGISPADVEDAPELYQFEDEISGLFENASIAVGEHLPFIDSMMESSWITLPPHESFNLTEGFLKSHCANDFPGQPAAVATLEGIAAYYGLECAQSSPAEQANTVAACYKALVQEHADEREGKGAAYWEAYAQRNAEANALEAQKQANAQMREKRLNQMNGLLWVSGAIIFTSVCIQSLQNSGDMGFIVICAVMVVFCLIRAVANFRKK